MPPRLPQPLLRRLLLLANLAAPVAGLATHFAQPSVLAGAALVHGLLIYALVAPGCSWLGPVATRFRTQSREVWLTIDDGPCGPETLELAGELQRRGVRATFFVRGDRLAAQTQVAALLEKAGHTLANHTQSHPAGLFWCLTPRRLREEIGKCDAALAAAGVGERIWFRSPVGLKHVLLHRVLGACGLRLVGWNVRGRDGLGADPAVVLARVLAGVGPGSIIVLHEGRPRSREGILMVVEALQQRGWQFVIPGDAQLL